MTRLTFQLLLDYDLNYLLQQNVYEGFPMDRRPSKCFIVVLIQSPDGWPVVNNTTMSGVLYVPK